jgi:anti-sigma factor NepR-like protein
MAGKDRFTQYTAPGAVDGVVEKAVEQPSGGEQSQPRESVNNEQWRLPGREEELRKQQSMASQSPSRDLEPPRAMLDRSLQAQLGRQLRAIFADISNEPVPDRFIKLLEELEAREKRR